MRLSIVTTLYKSLPFLEKYIQEFSDILLSMNITDYELLFVNDGSPDQSLEYLLKCQKSNNKIVIVDFTRNFGHHYALQAGIKEAKGDYIYLSDNDLETPSSFFKECWDTLIENEVELVYGVQETRKGHFIEKFGGKIFWQSMNLMSDVHIPPNLLTECLMTRLFTEKLLSLGDANIFLDGMIHWVGLPKNELTVKKGQRETKSTYTFSKRLDLLFQAVTSFTGKPLVWVFYIGISLIIVCFVLILILIIQKFYLGLNIELGWTSLILINVIILGITSTFMGMLGMYINKIFTQVQNRPNYLIKKTYK